MFGSGMNSSAVGWYILKTTNNEMALGMLVVLQTIPAMMLLPFSGVMIDREDRRRLVMWLDALRGLIILAVAILAFQHRARVWQLYAMNTLVAAGFWMFWPTITALIQELTPEGQFVQSNTFLMAGVQGGWLLAGAVVGFMYNHIGLGGVLLIDFSTYVVSFLCYFFVRKGRHVVMRPEHLREDIQAAENALLRFWHDIREALHFLRDHRPVALLGTSWALFLGAMMAGGIVTPSLSDRVFHAGAQGYGWLSAGWGTGAFVEHPLYGATARSAWRPAYDRIRDGTALSLYGHGSRVAFPLSGDSDLFHNGIGSRHRRRRHEHEPHGNGPQTSDGSSTERLQLCRNVSATRARARRRRSRTQCKPGLSIRHCSLRLRIVVRGHVCANRSTRGRRSRREVNCRRMTARVVSS